MPEKPTSREAKRPTKPPEHACQFDDTGEYSCGETPCILCHGPRRK